MFLFYKCFKLKHLPPGIASGALRKMKMCIYQLRFYYKQVLNGSVGVFINVMYILH